MERPKSRKAKQPEGAGPARKPTSHEKARSTTVAREGAAKARTAQAPVAGERAAEKMKDEARTLALLWGAQQKTGRSGLTVSTIVGHAVKVADQEGFDAVSMRRLAQELDVGTMSLYTHIPGKAELTDLMIDAAFGELYESVEEAQRQPGGYRERLRFVAERHRALYARHPWLLDVLLRRPVLGPHIAMKYETELRVLDGIGLTPLEMDSIRALLEMHVQATARLRVAYLRAQRADGMTEMQWWLAIIPLLKRVVVGDFPVSGRVGKAAGEALAPGPSDEHLYLFGLDLICDAVAALVARNQSEKEGA
jgi:AcrR family transcriptional regulator